jgi:hypothetical protein
VQLAHIASSVAGRSTRSLAIMDPRSIDRSKLEPRPENLSFALARIQGVVAAFGAVPLWLAIQLATSEQWGFVALWVAIFVAVEMAAFILIPRMASGGRGLR